MSFLTLFCTAIGLSMDAFAVSITNGMALKRHRFCAALKTGLFFGLFQALMPALGCLLGESLWKYIFNFDHWVAFGLLAFVGIRMICEAGETDVPANPTDTAKLLVMAVATSIDALAVGVGLAMVEVHILSTISVIGITTFCLSVIGVLLGTRLGGKFQKRAEIVGGVTLLLIGCKILAEHLFF